MKFRIWRCLGILCFGIMLFFLAVMQRPTDYWTSFFADLRMVEYQFILWGFILGLIGAAVFLSIKEE